MQNGFVWWLCVCVNKSTKYSSPFKFWMEIRTGQLHNERFPPINSTNLIYFFRTVWNRETLCLTWRFADWISRNSWNRWNALNAWFRNRQPGLLWRTASRSFWWWTSQGLLMINLIRFGSLLASLAQYGSGHKFRNSQSESSQYRRTIMVVWRIRCVRTQWLAWINDWLKFNKMNSISADEFRFLLICVPVDHRWSMMFDDHCNDQLMSWPNKLWLLKWQNNSNPNGKQAELARFGWG